MEGCSGCGSISPCRTEHIFQGNPHSKTGLTLRNFALLLPRALSTPLTVEESDTDANQLLKAQGTSQAGETFEDPALPSWETAKLGLPLPGSTEDSAQLNPINLSSSETGAQPLPMHSGSLGGDNLAVLLSEVWCGSGVCTKHPFPDYLAFHFS